MTRLIAASIAAIFAEQKRGVAVQSYNSRLKVFMKKGCANFRFAARDMNFSL
jgi:hypothetical protein